MLRCHDGATALVPFADVSKCSVQLCFDQLGRLGVGVARASYGDDNFALGVSLSQIP